MSSSDIAISVRGVSKAYTIRHQRADAATTLAEAITRRLRNPFRRQSESEQFWALKDVSFEVKRGEVVGIIGRNGAGKSTLLKILSRITEMTTGEVDLYGRVGSLLEVGTGFHQELTGRENIFLNGAILGMTRAEIKSQFDAIVDFAGVAKFLDTPVKRYSSGMYVRLAFAVAAHLRSEILIVDEVLAVGDAEFQKKCLGKMKEVSTDGRTVLFVSHNLASISALCDSALELAEGRLIGHGSADQVIGDYTSRTVDYAAQPDQNRRRGSGEYRIANAVFDRSCYLPSEVKTLRLHVHRMSEPAAPFFVVVHLNDSSGLTLLRCDSRSSNLELAPAEEHEIEFVLRSPWLKPGAYTVDLQLGAGGLVDALDAACGFDVAESLPYPGTAPAVTLDFGVVLADFRFSRAADEIVAHSSHSAERSHV